ncbi:MAG: sugar phosphate isomerase/epimerase [Bryobacterales bacterium]|nr:sugar phosphate isomerase/epimerase [Bryobacterales bacterium]
MPPHNRKMTIHLTPGAIGVKASQMETLEFAHYYGYEAVEPQAAYLAGIPPDQIRGIKDFLASRRLVWGCASLPVDFRTTDEKFTAGMSALPSQAKALEQAGATRMGTWLNPSHDTLTSRRNFDLHVKRLRAIAAILAQHNIRFGLEYVGPKTLWASRRYPFIHTMAETRELIAAIGANNVGFVLDSWHWYTAHETREDILSLTNKDVVSVDLNDAPAGVPVDQQIDSVRELPCATGVIDVAAFLNALQTIGYDGPVRPEPFNAALRRMPPGQALSVSLAAMQKAFALLRT